jgi:hypothetical protein
LLTASASGQPLAAVCGSAQAGHTSTHALSCSAAVRAV